MKNFFKLAALSAALTTLPACEDQPNQPPVITNPQEIQNNPKVEIAPVSVEEPLALLESTAPELLPQNFTNDLPPKFMPFIENLITKVVANPERAHAPDAALPTSFDIKGHHITIVFLTGPNSKELAGGYTQELHKDGVPDVREIFINIHKIDQIFNELNLPAEKRPYFYLAFLSQELWHAVLATYEIHDLTVDQIEALSELVSIYSQVTGIDYCNARIQVLRNKNPKDFHLFYEATIRGYQAMDAEFPHGVTPDNLDQAIRAYEAGTGLKRKK